MTTISASELVREVATGPSVRPPSVLPALVTGVVTHVRRRPMHRSFRYRVYQWLVDLDAVPAYSRPWSWLASFRAADHLGDPDRSIRANLEDFTSRHGVDISTGRVLMLANARAGGYAFDPLTVFWCLAPDGSLTCVVAEVRNTHGERHCYLLHPDETGRAYAEKSFYVSPFMTVEGEYELRFELVDDRVGASVTLRQDGEVAFVAAFRGRAAPATRRALVAASLRHPLMPLTVTLLIHWHGIRLWLRRMPVVPRRPHETQDGV